MAIVVYPSVKKGGGDIAFMVNIANSIADDLRITAPIVLVTEFTDVILEKHKLNPKIVMITPEVFEQRIQKKELIPTLIVEGPSFVFSRGIRPPVSAPILYLTEYSANEERTGTDTTTLLSLAKYRGYHAVSLESGFRLRDKLSTNVRLVQNKQREMGILLDKKCLAMFNESMSNPEEFRKNQWSNLSKEVAIKLLGTKDRFQYHTQTRLFFQYCHKMESVNNFLRALLDEVSASKDQKHCDYVSIGEGDRLKELEHAKESIIRSGFGKIIYVDKDNKEHKIYDDHKDQSKVFRLIAFPTLNHDDFLILLALSEKIVGVTGDQSFSEALVLGKIIIYECYGHKEAFFRGYIRLAEILGLNELAGFLNKYVYFIDETNTNLVDIAKSLSVVNYDKLYQSIIVLREHVLKEYDYRKVVLETMIELLQFIDPKKDCAKTNVIKTINNRLEELSPKMTVEHNDDFWELTFLVSVRRYSFSGLTIQEAVYNAKAELENQSEFVNRKKLLFFAKTFEIPSFVNDAIKQQLAENDKVTINTALSSNFDLVAPMLQQKSSP